MMWGNSTVRFGAVAMTFHWLIAGLIIFMFWLGPFMANLSETDPRQFPLFQLHKSIGLTILLLSLGRLFWRALNPVPDLPAHMPDWERFAARAVHYIFYALMIVVPLAGWATVSAAPIAVPTMWFGLFEWPHLPYLSTLPRAQKIVIDPSLQATHAILAFSWMALVALHVAAALKHHFKDRDQVLKHMLP